MKDNTKYIRNLDGIRAIAVSLVVLSHYGLGHIIPGGFGVTVFFFLSGYLITTLLIVEISEKSKVSLSNFFIRRLFRLFPPLFLILLIGYFLVYFSILSGDISIAGFLLQLFYFANYNQIYSLSEPGPDGLGVLWSLAVEEHFYLIFPFIFSFVYGKFKKTTLIYFVAISILLILFWRSYLFIYTGADHLRLYYATDTRIDGILFGVLLALLKNPYFSEDSENHKISFSGFFLIFLSLSLLFVSFIYRDTFFREAIRYTLQSAALIVIFYFSIKYSRNWLFFWLESNTLKYIGVLSYNIYLSHYLFYKLFSQYNLKVYYTVSFAIGFTFLFSYIVNRYIDNYFKYLRMKFR